MKEVAKLSLALGAVCTVASALLAMTNTLTADRIAAARVAKKKAAFAQVLPEFDNDPLAASCSFGEVVFYRGSRDGVLVGVAGEGAAGGFGGPVKVLVGILPDGTLTRVVVTGHTETPGLGTAVTDRKQQMTVNDLFRPAASDVGVPPNGFLDQFGPAPECACRNVAEAPFKLKADAGTLDAISGATISSRAVADAVTRVVTAFNENRAGILAMEEQAP